ncbi:cytidine deaminase-like protein [Lenzites betulinus]|nr:cytidine deaminase-like protein [Lenzites betulinus]
MSPRRTRSLLEALSSTLALTLTLALLLGSSCVSGAAVHAHAHLHVHPRAPLQDVLAAPTLTINGVPPSVRETWMRRANAALAEAGPPCPFGAFASVVVNHTASVAGELVCSGVNAARNTGDPTLHGEIVAIQNCTAVLTDPAGAHRLTPAQAQAAFADLTLYTNAESCPMCASAIRIAGFREYVYGASIARLVELGWAQIRVPSANIFRAASDLPNAARLLGGVLAEETDPLFAWQFDDGAPCPLGCARPVGGGACVAS